MQFIALHNDMQPTDVAWPAMKAHHSYWTEAAQYIKDTADTENPRDYYYYYYYHYRYRYLYRYRYCYRYHYHYYYHYHYFFIIFFNNKTIKFIVHNNT